MSTPPLALTLLLPKPRWIGGEGIELSLHQRALADLELESVDLNQSRTTIELTALHDRAPVLQRLRGVDHCALHRVSMFQAIGERFSVRAGDEWESRVELLLFARPLPVGRYRVALSYQYGPQPHELVRTDAVELEVVPAAVDHVALRWFGAADPKDELAALWAATADGDRRWWLHRAAGFDPGVLRTSAAIGPDPTGQAAPVLAHLDDVGAMHFGRFVAWPEPDALVVLPVQPRGRIAAPERVAHGLVGPVVLADPPLQRRDGGLSAVVLGHDDTAAPVARLVHAGPNPLPPGPVLPLPTATLPTAAVVAWHGVQDPVSGVLCLLEPGPPAWRVHAVELVGGAHRPLLEHPEPLTQLSIDQWLGLGHVVAIGRQGTRLRSWSWPLSALDAASAVPATLLDLAAHDPPWQGPHEIVTTHGGRHVALLLEDRDRFVVVGAEGTHAVDKARLHGAAVPRLVVTRQGPAFLLEHDPAQGFVAHPVQG